MSLNELRDLLKTTGIPVAYHRFTSPPSLPYILYLFYASDNFGADDKVYQKFNNFQVELYSNKKDLESERLIEDLFDENDIYYEKSEEYIKSEKLYQVLYEIQV